MTPDSSLNPHDPEREPLPTVVDEDAPPRAEDEHVAELLQHTIDVPVLASAVEAQEAADAADTLENLPDEEAASVLVAMADQAAADTLSEMNGPLAARVVDDLLDEGRQDYAGKLVGLMAADDAADLLQELDEHERDALLDALSPVIRSKLARLIGYRDDTAAGLMTVDFVTLRAGDSVAGATETIRRGEVPEELAELPVVDEQRRFVGVVSLRTLLLAPDDRLLSELLAPESRAIRDDLDQEAVAREFDRYDFSMLPVVDSAGRLLGVVTVDDVIDIIREEHTEDVHRSVGAGAEEAVYSSVGEKFRGRFPWLVISSLMMIPAAWIILRFDFLIAEMAILAMLMPVVAALSGNAGHQALAVTLRGIVLEEVRRDRVVPLVRRELIVGLLNGAGVGLLVGLVVAGLALVNQDASWRLGIVAALSMTFSMAAGTFAGAGIPLAMRRIGFDPAQSSAIFLIMITDAVAFATFLGLVWFAHDWLL